jgi:folate-binding protein YgfZ
VTATSAPPIQREYDALTKAVALVDRSAVGRLSITGDDALDLIDRLSTNALQGLEAGHGERTVLTSNKGRIVDVLFVLREAESLLVLTGPDNQEKVSGWLDFYTIIEDITTRDITGETAMFSLVGPGAPATLRTLMPAQTEPPDADEAISAVIGGVQSTIIRTDFIGVPAYDMVVALTDGPKLRDTLLETGAEPAGFDPTEALRVELGIPAFGKELGESYNPLEAGLLPLISFTKGCYIGQEVVARLNTYDKVKKRLVGLRWNGESPEAGAPLLREGKLAGVVTTAARSPRFAGGIGLGYVRKALAAPGTELVVDSSGGPTPVHVAALPLDGE